MMHALFPTQMEKGVGFQQNTDVLKHMNITCSGTIVLSVETSKLTSSPVAADRQLCSGTDREKQELQEILPRHVRTEV